MNVPWRAVNAAGMAASAAFGVAGALQPTFSVPQDTWTQRAHYWSVMSGVRTMAVAAVILVRVARNQPPGSDLWRVAGLMQLGDAGIGVWRRNPQMVVLPAVLGVTHLLAARQASSHPSDEQPVRDVGASDA